GPAVARDRPPRRGRARRRSAAVAGVDVVRAARSTHRAAPRRAVGTRSARIPPRGLHAAVPAFAAPERACQPAGDTAPAQPPLGEPPRRDGSRERRAPRRAPPAARPGALAVRASPPRQTRGPPHSGPRRPAPRPDP